MKCCIKCKTDKNEGDFGICKSEKDGLQKTCKSCAKQYRDANKGKTMLYNEQYRSLDVNKKKALAYSKEYYKDNDDKFKTLSRVRYNENKEDVLEKAKQYYIKNKDEINKKKTIYTAIRLKNDSLFKMKMNIRTLIRSSFSLNGKKKNSKTSTILGCTFQEFKEHLEKQFDDKMNWSNQGPYWHMDHIKPVSLATNEQELIELNHYTNFQPLEKYENLSKSNKYNVETEK